jgi:hypothetical protein
MKNSTKNRMGMYKAVLQVIQEHEPVWAGVPKLVSDVEKLEQGIIFLENRIMLQSSITIGVAKMRQEKFGALSKKIIAVQDALWIYGTASNNVELAARHKYSPSKTEKLSAADRLVRMDIVLSDLSIYGIALGEYGITPDTIATVIGLMEEYHTISGNPRKSMIDRKTISAAIDAKTSEITFLLRDELDRLIRMFAVSEPNFVKSYFNARMVVDQKGKKNKVSDSTIEPEGSE